MPEERGNPRFFTLGEAERLLPRVESAVRGVIQLSEEGERVQSELQHWLRKIAMSGGGVVDHSGIVIRKERLREIAGRLQESVELLERLGCLLKDLKMGLVDFPTRFRGEEVYLCWKLGEDSIRFWHGVTEGFRGRKPIDADFIRRHGISPGDPGERLH